MHWRLHICLESTKVIRKRSKKSKKYLKARNKNKYQKSTEPDQLISQNEV